MSRLATARAYGRARMIADHAMCFLRRDVYLQSAHYWLGRGNPSSVREYIALARLWNHKGIVSKLSLRHQR